MDQQSPDYKVLFFAQQHRYEEERRRREAAEQAQKTLEENTRKTTLPDYLDACHDYLYSGLTVQNDATKSTRGDPANALNKLRPDRILIWDEFPAIQEAIWEDLMQSEFVSERHFTSVHSLREIGQGYQQRKLGSEQDLHSFQRYTVEDPVSLIVNRMYSNLALRRKYGLNGSISFENHANSLSPDVQLGMERMAISESRRRSPRLQAKAKAAGPSSFRDPIPSGTAATAGRVKTARPRADQFCVYNTGTGPDNESRTAAFISEYKAPHKLPLGFIYEGLGDMVLEDVIQHCETESPQDRYRRLVAAVITQAFSYMVRSGLQYGSICTGEACIFLHVPNDPRTVYYFLSVPKGDVGPSTGWALPSDGPNRLHLTAVGQMLAFTLQTLRATPRTQKWRAEAARQLSTWETTYEALLDTIPESDAPSSEYRPPRQNLLLRMSPIQLRRRLAPTGPSNCSRPWDQHETGDEDSDPDTPSQGRSFRPSAYTPAAVGSSPSAEKSVEERHGGKYCTQNCLRGLVDGGPLDMLCPNARHHGKGFHQIDQLTFISLIRKQLADDLDTDCKPASLPGACGVLFRVRLRSHGYIVAAKCTPADSARCLKWEAIVYEQLRPIQGVHVPVHLGNIDLETPYFYEGIAELAHMMFLSFGGRPILRYLTEKRACLARHVDTSTHAIHDLGVLHGDLMPRNILWNQETGRVMVIDFERAKMVKPRVVLGPLSANRKRKAKIEDRSLKPGGAGSSAFVQERQRAAFELRDLR